MSWYSILPYILACLGLLFIPGGLIAFALGLRNLTFAAVTPIFTVAVVAGTAVAVQVAGIGWSPQVVAAVSVLLAACAFGIAFLTNRARGKAATWRVELPGARRYAFPAIGFLGGAVSIGIQLRDAFGRPDNFSQTFDNIFHLNAVRYILDTGNASSLTMSSMTSGDAPPFFYPAAWHDLASLLIEITGAPVNVGVNVLNICVAAVVWPLGCMLLTRTLAGPNPYAIGAAGILSAGFGAFPLLLLDFGVLYPNFLSVSMLPAALACVAVFFGIGDSSRFRGLTRYSLAPLAAAGVAIAHPNGLMSLIALSGPLILSSYVWFCIKRRRAGLPARMSILLGTGLLGLLAVVAVMWKFIRPPAEAASWPTVQTVGQAVGEVVTNSGMKHPAAWVISALMIAGLVFLLRKPTKVWFIGSFFIAAVLFVVVSAENNKVLRNALTGVWYNDSYRLAALMPVVAVPLAALGAVWLCRKLQMLWTSIQATSSLKRVAWTQARWSGGVVLPLALMSVLSVVQSIPLQSSIAVTLSHYTAGPDAPLVSADELKVINEIDALVPKDATIAVNPWNGGALAFALADRKTTSKHTLTTYTSDELLLNDSLRDVEKNPAVCPAARSTGVQYVLDFGTQEVHGGNHGFQGLLIPDSAPGFELLAKDGAAKLFKLTACN
ncbi:DUF6541 family protein [Arthrobacter sp. NPDC058127]|uniref:DUF6541 family protein n=1 Tax=Arthrobacter sp. NPDC058127 TaxID=3346351 RepID=UPI0036E1EBD7